MLDAEGLLGGCEFEGGDVWLGLYGVEQSCKGMVRVELQGAVV